MAPKQIKVDTYEELESKVLECLRDELVWDVCVAGWKGYGASAVLRRAAEAAEKKELIGMQFDTVIELVRPAGYGSPREAQRAVAEQLNLEPAIMAKFDEADEDDDFRLEPAGSRRKIMEVGKEIYRAVKDRRVLLVHGASMTDEHSKVIIDFNDLDIPIVRWGPNKVLWTTGRGFARRERFSSDEQPDAFWERGDAGVWVSDRSSAAAAGALQCVYAEAVEIARYINNESSSGTGTTTAGRLQLQATPSTVHRCLCYLSLLDWYIGEDGGQVRRRLRVVDYLVCEPILQQGELDLGDHHAAACCWEMGKAVARLASTAGEDVRELWDEMITSGGLLSSSPDQLLPPKTLLVHRRYGYEQKLHIQSSPSQGEESYRWMAVNISPNDPAELGNFLDNICRRDLEHGTSVLCDISSIFVQFLWICQALPDRFFERFSNVRVLDLFGCIVGPMDSSFVHLRNLRMLRMEKCKVTGEQYSAVNASPHSLAQEAGLGGPIILFDSLWVLILYNSDADKFLSAGEALDHMPNLRKFDLEDETSAFPRLGARKGLGSLRKLRFNCPVQPEEIDHEGFFRHTHELQSFKLSYNTHIKFLPKSLSMAINLRKLILDNCWRLESLNLNHLPATIETVSLRWCTSLREVEPADPTSLPNLKTFRLSVSELITKLSLQGCRKLENVELQGLLKLEVLNLSCTAVKVLELDYPYPPQLKQLYLLGCEQLHRVVVGKRRELPSLDELYLDNYNNTCSVDRCLESFQKKTEDYTTTGISHAADGRFFQAHLVVRDVRLFRSLQQAFPAHLDRTRFRLHIHVKCSSTIKRGDITDTTTKPGARITSTTKSSPLIVSNLSTPRYADALDAMKDHRRPHHPSPPAMPLNNHIEVDGGNRRSLIEESFREFMRFAESLFVHEDTSALAANVSMSGLKWFRIENCPNMEVVFADWDKGGGNVLVELESMWLSHLPRLDAICKRGIMVVPESYSQLKYIYLEFCARLKYALPSLSEPCNLETIDIRNCGDLRAIYDDEQQRGAIPKQLPKLRSIHLEELPKLQHIYKPIICAPSLQDVVIRGCSSLRKLSLFDRLDGQSRRVVKISCEKDWWGNLKWDEPEANYRSFRFDHKHCPCYRKPMKARWL